VIPGETNGIRDPSNLMVDKITTEHPCADLGERIGRLGDDNMVRFGRAVVVLLGVAGS